MSTTRPKSADFITFHPQSTFDQTSHHLQLSVDVELQMMQLSQGREGR